MGFKQLTNGARVAIEYLWNSEVVTNIIHVVAESPMTELVLSAIGETVSDWITEEVMPLQSGDMTATAIVVTDINEPDSIQVVTPITSGGIGGVALDSTPNNVALVASLRTERIGRSFRGRFFVPGFPEVNIDGNEITVARQLEWALIFADLDTELDIIDIDWVVASFVSAGEPRVEGVGTPIDAVVIDSRVDTQRRRMPQ